MITVLVATYNGRAFIEEQLDSIRLQTVTPDEVLICDDCSTDGTDIFVSEYISKHGLKNWKLLKNIDNKGHYKTFIYLATQATSDYIFFSDQDDIWDEQKIERLEVELRKNPEVSMVFCQSKFIDEQNQVFVTPTVSNKVYDYQFKELLKKWPSGYQTAYKKYVIEDILKNHYDKEPSFQFHDVLFGMLAGIYGQVLAVDFLLDNHRIHRNNVTLSSESKPLNNSLESRLNYYEKMINRYNFISKVIVEKGKEDDMIADVAKSYSQLYEHRLKFVKSRNILSFIQMIKLYSYCNGLRGLLSDIVYAFRIHSLLNKIMKILRK